MINIDEAKSLFDCYRTNISTFTNTSLTESDTRSKLLDEMFKGVLGWSENDIERERFVQVGYFDYLFSIPGFQFIVEAKKSMTEFQLPVRHKSTKLETFAKSNPDVFKQIREYLLETGLQYGVVTNGKQFILGRFINNNGEEWKKNGCIIFHDLDDIDTRFVEFYNLLSKFAVIENCGFLVQSEELKKGSILLSSIHNKDKELIRNTLSSSLIPVIDKVFGEIYRYESLDNKELIQECFIENEEIKKNKSDIEKLFADRPPELSEVIPARNTKNIALQIQSELENHPITLKDIDPPKPIIIVGSKGAGKTTFINYLFKLSFSAEFLYSRPYIYLDFRKYVEEDLERINDVVLRDAIEALYDNYPDLELHTMRVLKRIFFKEIKQNDESTWQYDKHNFIDRYNEKLNSFLEDNRNNKEFYFNKLSEYLIRERRLRLCLVIDNADQFDTNVQRKAFLFAQSLNLKAKCAVIISLREGYYYRWRHQPPFDAFEKSNVYHITAPPYKDVLQKRIDYALKNIKVDGKATGAMGKSLSVEISNESVVLFLQNVRQNLFGDENAEMLTFLEETTYPNIREGLEIFKHFLLSGHTEVAEYILRQQISPQRSNSIPFWEFVKAVALDNKKYYNHEISKINNLFYPAGDNKSHFLKIRLLKYLFIRADKLGYSEKFIPANSVVSIFVNAGYKLANLVAELNELLQLRFIETDDSISDQESEATFKDSQNISITLKGSYYINKFISSFVYIDLILQDTPIFVNEFYEKIRRSFSLANEQGKQNLQSRITTANHFIEYLTYQEKLEMSLNEEIPNDVVKDMLNNGLYHDLERVKRAL